MVPILTKILKRLHSKSQGLGSGFQHSFETLTPEECFIIGITAKEIPEHLFGVLRSTTLEDLVSIIRSNFWIEESFLLETSLKHVEAKNFAPLKKLE